METENSSEEHIVVINNELSAMQKCERLRKCKEFCRIQKIIYIAALISIVSLIFLLDVPSLLKSDDDQVNEQTVIEKKITQLRGQVSFEKLFKISVKKYRGFQIGLYHLVIARHTLECIIWSWVEPYYTVRFSLGID